MGRKTQVQEEWSAQEALRPASAAKLSEVRLPAPAGTSPNAEKPTSSVRNGNPPCRYAAETPLRIRDTWVSVASIGLFALAALYSIYFARDFVLPVTAAVLLKLVLSPAVRELKKWGVPEGIGAGVMVLFALTFGFGVVYQLSGPAKQWVERAPSVLEVTENKLRDVKNSMANISRAAEQVEKIASVNGQPAPTPVALSGESLGSLVVQSTRSFLAMAVGTIVLLYLLLASGDLFVRRAITALRHRHDKARAYHLSRKLEETLSRYLLTISAINLGLGGVVAFAMYLLEMPNPVLWGAMVALFNFVPYLGALTSLTILTLAALVTFDDLGRVLMVAVSFFSLNLLEAYVVTPMLLGYRMRMNPVAIFISIMFFGWAWGVYGILVAVPLLVTFKLVCDHVESLTPVGQFLSG